MNKRVFVLDDSPEFIFLLHGLFKLKSIELFSETSLESAKMTIQKFNFSLLIIDYMLPKSNGIEFIKEIRKIEQYKNTPVILLTAKKLELEELQMIKELGGLFLRKPIQPLEFYNKINGLILR